MPRRARWALLGVAVGAGVLALTLAQPRAQAPTVASAVSSATAPPFAAASWPAGATARYALSFTSDVEVDLGLAGASGASGGARGRTLATSLAIEGELGVRSYQPARAGDVTLGFTLARVRVTRATALGAPVGDVDALAAELRAAEATAIVAEDGRVRELAFSPATTPFARGALRALVLEYTANAGGPGSADTSIGRARVERAPAGELRRVAYEELDALPAGLGGRGARVTATVRRAEGAGPMRELASDERVEASADEGLVSELRATTRFSAKLAGVEREAAVAAPAYAPSPVRPQAGEVGEAGDRAASLARRAAGVTAESVHADVRLAAALPQKRFTEWLWRDSAYLELHPEESSRLLDRVMKDPAAGLELRAAAVDLVVVVGDDAAQRALVHAFEAYTLPPDDREILLQHVAHVARPSRDLLRFVEAEHTRARGTPLRLATSYALGGLAGHAAAQHPDVADRLVATLERDLGAAKDDRDREIAIRALGNAGAARSLPAIVSYATSPSIDVRAAVAGALRRVEGSASVDALVALVQDANEEVAREAVASLYRKQLDDDDWRALARAIDEDRIAEGAHAVLLDGALLRRADDPGAAVLFTAMLASPKVAYALKTRVATAQID